MKDIFQKALMSQFKGGAADSWGVIIEITKDGTTEKFEHVLNKKNNGKYELVAAPSNFSAKYDISDDKAIPYETFKTDHPDATVLDIIFTGKIRNDQNEMNKKEKKKKKSQCRQDINTISKLYKSYSGGSGNLDEVTKIMPLVTNLVGTAGDQYDSSEVIVKLFHCIGIVNNIIDSPENELMNDKGTQYFDKLSCNIIQPYVKNYYNLLGLVSCQMNKNLPANTVNRNNKINKFKYFYSEIYNITIKVESGGPKHINSINDRLKEISNRPDDYTMFICPKKYVMFTLSSGNTSQISKFKITNMFDDIVLDGMPYRLMAVIRHDGTGGDKGYGHYISYLRQIKSFDKLDKKYSINTVDHNGLKKKDIDGIVDLLCNTGTINISSDTQYIKSFKTFIKFLNNILKNYNNISNNTLIKQLVSNITNINELRTIINKRLIRKDNKNFNKIDIIAQLITINLLSIGDNTRKYKNNPTYMKKHKKEAQTYILNILLLILSTCPDKVPEYRQLQLTQDKFYIADDASPVKTIDNTKLSDYQNGYMFMYVSAKQYYKLQMENDIVNKEPRPMVNGGNNLCFFNSAFQMLMRMTGPNGIQQYFE